MGSNREESNNMAMALRSVTLPCFRKLGPRVKMTVNPQEIEKQVNAQE